MGDEGLAVGAARAAFDLYGGPASSPGAARQLGRNTVALGPTPCESAAETLRIVGLVHRRLPESDTRRQLVLALASSQVVALARGRQEFGPRALGLRSVLAAADDLSLNTRLNAKLQRTEFMPFAPVVREERMAEVFDLASVPSDVTGCMCFMTICLPVRDWAAKACPVVVHVDGTARPQVVREQDDPFLHALLTDYERRTGLPLLVNTSFNLHDEPIVSTASDAIAAFLAAELDWLLLEDCLVALEENQQALHLARTTSRRNGCVQKARHAALNRSFGRQIFEGPGRFSDVLPAPGRDVIGEAAPTPTSG